MILHFIVVLVFMLAGPGEAIARVGTLGGSISILHEYDSNIHLTERNEKGGWFTTIYPSLVYTSEAATNNLSFGYAPGLRYDHNENEIEVDHYLTLEGDRRLSDHFLLKFRDRYIRSDDYTYFVLEHVQQEGAGVHLSGERVRRQYWVNSISLEGDYEYARDSGLGVGYSNRILQNDTARLDDYMRHQAFMTIDHRFNRHWGTRLSYDYIRGDFDNTEDIDQHLAGVTVKYNTSPRQIFFGAYQYTDSRYEQRENDYQLHRGDLGWQRNLNKHSTVAAWTGASYLEREAASNEYAFNYAVSLAREIKRGKLSIGGRGGMDELHFNAIDREKGLSRFWSFRGSFDYLLDKDLSGNTYLSYRNDDFLDNDLEDRSFVGGVTVSYSFQRWYALSIGYGFRQLRTDRQVDDYQDHRAYVQLSAGKEIARWR
jgi:hypothetical protein